MQSRNHAGPFQGVIQRNSYQPQYKNHYNTHSPQAPPFHPQLEVYMRENQQLKQQNAFLLQQNSKLERELGLIEIKQTELNPEILYPSIKVLQPKAKRRNLLEFANKDTSINANMIAHPLGTGFIIKSKQFRKSLPHNHISEIVSSPEANHSAQVQNAFRKNQLKDRSRLPPEAPNVIEGRFIQSINPASNRKICMQPSFLFQKHDRLMENREKDSLLLGERSQKSKDKSQISLSKNLFLPPNKKYLPLGSNVEVNRYKNQGPSQLSLYGQTASHNSIHPLPPPSLSYLSSKLPHSVANLHKQRGSYEHYNSSTMSTIPNNYYSQQFSTERQIQECKWKHSELKKESECSPRFVCGIKPGKTQRSSHHYKHITSLTEAPSPSSGFDSRDSKDKSEIKYFRKRKEVGQLPSPITEQKHEEQKSSYPYFYHEHQQSIQQKVNENPIIGVDGVKENNISDIRYNGTNSSQMISKNKAQILKQRLKSVQIALEKLKSENKKLKSQ